MPNGILPPGVTVVPVQVTIDVDLPLPDAVAGNFTIVQQWVADHLQFSASLASGVRAMTIAPRGAGLFRKGAAQ